MKETQNAPGAMTETRPTLPEPHDQSPWDDPDEGKPRPLPRLKPRHIVTVAAVLTLLAILALVPPLINLGRFRRGIVTSISGTLGRPVRVDNVTLQLLPLPGFTLSHFVVGEDPAFGAEPVIRADQVQVRVRFRSLWRRHLEFSRIILNDPSVNLVHGPDGRWNFESILLRAASVPAAPTAQSQAGDAPRFPYIEATNARVNFKSGVEKLPISLTEADLALWLPEPETWRVRLKAHPDRTDAAAADTGILRLEGSLGHSSALDAMPLRLQADWTGAPLGGSSLLVLGRDANVRGDMDLHVSVQGTVAHNALRTELSFSGVRRADFVPERPLEGQVVCTAAAQDRFHALTDVRCNLPGSGTPAVSLVGSLPNTEAPGSFQGNLRFDQIPASRLVDLLGVLSSRISPDLQAAGSLSGQLPCCGSEAGTGTPETSGNSLTLTGPQLSMAGDAPLIVPTPGSAAVTGAPVTAALAATAGGPRLVLSPIALALADGREPALLQLTLTPQGYTMHLVGPALRSRLRTLARTIPPLCDGMDAVLPPVAAGVATTPAHDAEIDAANEPATPSGPASDPGTPFHLDVTAQRSWTGGPALWSTGLPVAPTVLRRKGR